MRAIVLQLDGSVIATETADPQPVAGEAVIRVAAAALNRRDYWFSKGLYPGLTPPVVLGSDGVGEVVAVGEGVDSSLIGERRLINPSFNWGNNEAVQGDDYTILGNPRNGTLAEYISVPVDRLHAVPAHLSDDQAAALPLAGLTAFRALISKAAAQKDERVVITGIGGGVAQMALAFAVAQGCKVAVSSSSADKRAFALTLGAEAAYDYRDPQWSKTLRKEFGGIDVAIDGGGGEQFPALVSIANFGARIAIYGATSGDAPSLGLRSIFWKQISILGTSMGSDRDFAAMLDFVSNHKIKPVIDQVYPLADIGAALARMEKGEQLGKMVVTP